MVPLLLFVAGYAAAALAVPGAAEGPLVLAGLAGMTLGFLSVWVFGRKHRTLPDVVRKLPPHQSVEAAADGRAGLD
jgi:hypothetical protein